MNAHPESSAPNGAPVGPALVVVAGAIAPIAQRVEGTFTEEGLTAPSLLSSLDEIDEVTIDDSTVIALVCDVDSTGGMAALRRLRRRLRETAIVVISAPATGTGVRRALDAGADAVVFEPEIETALPVAVLAVANGQSVVPRKLRASVETPTFSHRERQVLALVSTGLTNGEIAERLTLAQSTIKSHLSTAFAKLGIRSRKEVATLLNDPEQARSLGLAGIDEIATGFALQPTGRDGGLQQPIA
jgi:DNA-binding NarL/FixJ family response regulator